MLVGRAARASLEGGDHKGRTQGPAARGGPAESGSPSLAGGTFRLGDCMETNMICLVFALAEVLKISILKTDFLHNPLMMAESFLLVFYCLFEI